MIPCIASSALELLDEKACRALWLRRFWPMGPVCPVCKTSITGPSADTFAEGKLIRCRDCGKWFDCRTATPLSGLHATWAQLTLFLTLHSTGLKVSQIASLCHISDDTVRRLSRRLIEGADA